MKACDVCGCPMCFIYQCDPFYSGCGFECETCDLPEEYFEKCPECRKVLTMKRCCYHPQLGGCGHIEELQHGAHLYD
jgi:hypothetical protein